MDAGPDALPDDVAALKAALVAARERATVAEAEVATVRARLADDQALIAQLKLQIEKLRRTLFGQRSERSERLLDQLELQLEEAEASASQDELAAELMVARTAPMAGATRRRPSRQPFPTHLPRERVLVPGPMACPCCGSGKLSKLGEDVTETLEVVPRQWPRRSADRCPSRMRIDDLLVIDGDPARPGKFSCRDCEAVTQPPAPFHVIPRGWAGSSLLAMILFEKFGQHQPLNRQAERYAREGVPLSLSTLADQVGACAAALQPIHERIRAHVLAGLRLHGDDTTVPVLAKGKTDIARCPPRPPGLGHSMERMIGLLTDHGRMYVMIGRSAVRPRRQPCSAIPATVPASIRSVISKAGAVFCRLMPMAAMVGSMGLAGSWKPAAFQASWPGSPWESDRSSADERWAHARRKFFELADLAAAARRRTQGKAAAASSPLALEAVQRIDALFTIERDLNGLSADQRLIGRQERSAPLIAELEAWLRQERARLSRHAEVAKAIDYLLKRWAAFTRFLVDGRICLSNNAAEQALRGIALGRKAWLFAGSDRGGERAAVIYSLIVTAKLNHVDPQTWLADVLGRIAAHPANRLDELVPWNWTPKAEAAQVA